MTMRDIRIDIAKAAGPVIRSRMPRSEAYQLTAYLLASSH